MPESLITSLGWKRSKIDIKNYTTQADKIPELLVTRRLTTFKVKHNK
jgi:hypothetical protein